MLADLVNTADCFLHHTSSALQSVTGFTDLKGTIASS